MENLVVGDGHWHGCRHLYGLLEGIERHRCVLLLTLQPSLRQVTRHRRHPRLSLLRVFQRTNFTEYQHERVVQQIVGSLFVSRIVTADAMQPVVHQVVELAESLLVTLLTTFYDLLHAPFAHRPSPYFTTTLRVPIIYIPGFRLRTSARWPLRVNASSDITRSYTGLTAVSGSYSHPST